jgi:hypothetical protein
MVESLSAVQSLLHLFELLVRSKGQLFHHKQLARLPVKQYTAIAVRHIKLHLIIVMEILCGKLMAVAAILLAHSKP